MQHVTLDLPTHDDPASLHDFGPEEHTDHREPVADRIVRNVRTPSLRVSLPEPTGTRRPAVLVFPGGGYGVLSMIKEGEAVADWMAGLGFVGAAVKYRLPYEEAPFFVALKDADAAYAMLVDRADEWEIDTNRIGVIGFSAGGHLAGCLCNVPFGETGPPVLSFAALIYPVLSMEEEISHGGSRKRLLGVNPDLKAIAEFSLESRVTSATPPTFLAHCEDDKAVPADHSMRYVTACRKAGVPCQLSLFGAGGHGFGRGRHVPGIDWPEQIETWLRERELLPRRPGG